MTALIYSTRSAIKLTLGACLGVAAVATALVVNAGLLLPLVALCGAAVTVAALKKENIKLRAKLADERDRGARLRHACTKVLEVLPEGHVANFLAAALVAGRPQPGSTTPQAELINEGRDANTQDLNMCPAPKR